MGWRRSTLAVCEVILADVAAPTVSSVVAVTEMSLGSVAQALKFLEQDGHLEKSVDRGPDAARRVVDRDMLLDAYAMAAARLRYPTSIETGVTSDRAWATIVPRPAECRRRVQAP